MLYLILTKLNPRSIVIVEVITEKLETIRLQKFKNNIDDMCDEIKNTMKQIIYMKILYESICCYQITALGSGLNTKFNAMINHINDNIKSCTGIPQNKTW